MIAKSASLKERVFPRFSLGFATARKVKFKFVKLTWVQALLQILAAQTHDQSTM